MGNRPHLEDTQQVFLPPASGERKPGPIHSLILDESGNHYCSDELNHRVLSLDAVGDLRWQIEATGFNPSPLHYPRGLAIGWTHVDGSLHHCLAVCDSWNNRIVFLNLAGHPVTQWNVAGDIRFHEVCDVRFVSNSSGTGDPDEEGKGYWLVLDRGNHRLCALGLDGRLLFQVGHAFSPNLVHTWRIPSRDWIEQPTETAGIIDVFEPADEVYYPTRIVGGSGPGSAIYVWEPLFRKLNQVLFGNLLPIRMPLSCDECFAADATAIIGWSVASRQLQRFGSNRELVQEIPLEGTPVAADLSREEVWVQQETRMVRHTWRKDAALSSSKPTDTAFPILLHSAEEDLQQFNLDEVDKARDEYLRCIDSVLNLADTLLPEQSKLDLLIDDRREAWPRWNRKVAPWHLGVLKWKLAEVQGTTSGSSRSAAFEEGIRKTWEQLSRPFLAKFREVMHRLDAVLLMRYDWESRASEPADRNQELLTFTARLEAELWRIVDELCQASGVVRGHAKVVDLNRPSGNSLQFPAARRRSDFALREVARWTWKDFDQSLTSPYGLTASSEGSLFVTLWKNRSVLELDKKDGRPLTRLELPLQLPGGIALDGLGRLWIADASLNAAVVVWRFESARSHIVKGEEVGSFRGPIGICRGPDGSMLISDHGNHRIVRVSYDGQCDVFAGGKRGGPAPFQHPRSLYRGDTFLVADHRNHRIQKLDSSGQIIGQIGGCGLEKGKLVLPLSVAQFDDGAIAVSMWHVARRLVLLSSEGEELGHTEIDYSPGDMLVDDGRLLVPDFEGNAIRVYARS